MLGNMNCQSVLKVPDIYRTHLQTKQCQTDLWQFDVVYKK